MTLALCFVDPLFYRLTDAGWRKTPKTHFRYYCAFAGRKKDTDSLLGEAIANPGKIIVVKEGPDPIPPVKSVPVKSVPDTELTQFIIEACIPSPGKKVLFADFYDRFQTWLPASEKHCWTKRSVSGLLAAPYAVVAGNGNRRFVSGLTFLEA